MKQKINERLATAIKAFNFLEQFWRLRNYFINLHLLNQSIPRRINAVLKNIGSQTNNRNY